MPKHYLKMSAADIVAKAHEAMTRNDNSGLSEWGGEILTNSSALEYVQTRMQHSNSVDVDLISRVIATRCYEIREEYEADRPQLFFLNMFSERGLFSSLNAGVMAYINREYDYAVGPVRFIGDKTDDWPTTGGRAVTPSMNMVKYYAKAVEYGILELWQGANEGRDIVSERVADAYTDLDHFLDVLIAQGAPLHGLYGFLNHPEIPVNTVPATTGPNAPATDWPSKSPEEIIFDLQVMRDSTRVASNYNEVADTLILSDMRYTYANATQIGTNGDMILSRWAQNQAASVIKGLESIVPFVPYDTAGPGGTPIAMAGSFNRTNIEMPLISFPTGGTVYQMPTEYHGSKWKIGFIAGAGSVHVKRKGRFQTFTGI